MNRGIGIYKRKKTVNSSLPNVIITFLICAACWYIGYNYSIGFPVRSDTGTSLLWRTVCELLSERNYMYIAGFSLLLLSAALVQRLNFLHVITQGKTTLPFLFFLLLNSINPDFFPVRPISVVFFLLLVALLELFGAYQNPAATGRIFKVMFCLALMSLVWPYSLWFVPFFWVGMYQFRILNVRTFAASLLGLFTVFWFVLGWCVWKQDFAVFVNLAQCVTDFQLFFVKESWSSNWPSLLPVFCLTLFMSIHISLRELESNQKSRHFLSFLLLIGFVSFLLSLLYISDFVDFICIFHLPVSLVAAHFFFDKYGFKSFLFYYLFVALLVILFFVRIWNIL